MNSHNYYVYLLANRKQGALYIGVTNNLERRVSEHKLGQMKGFAQKYQINRLVYYEYFTDISAAIAREKELKKWRREWKINLSVKDNPHWDDISLEWFGAKSKSPGDGSRAACCASPRDDKEKITA